MNITVNVHLADLPALLRMGASILHELAEIRQTQQEIIAMSESNSAQVAAAFAEINTTLDSIGTDVTNIAADVDGLLAGMTPGDPVTAEMVSAATAIRDRVAAIKTSLDAVDAKVPAAAP